MKNPVVAVFGRPQLPEGNAATALSSMIAMGLIGSRYWYLGIRNVEGMIIIISVKIKVAAGSTDLV